MFFTRVLMLYKKHRGTSGLLHAGKHRALPYISVSLKRQALRWLLLEQDNLQALSTPYLTQEESRGHMAENKYQDKWLAEKRRESAQRMLPHRLTTDLLKQLKTEKKWE